MNEVWKGLGLPIWQLMRKMLLLAVGLLLIAACGGGQNSSADLPPMPSTATPTQQSTMVISPTAQPEGVLLEPLEEGQEVAPGDDRYSLVIPEFWVRGTAPPAEIAYRESGGTPVDHGYSYNVMREELSPTVTSVEEYAAAGRAAVEERFTDVETLSIEPVQVAGVQGVRWEYTATITSEAVYIHQVYVVDGGTGFLLTGSAPADGDPGEAGKLFDSIAGSFSFPRG